MPRRKTGFPHPGTPRSKGCKNARNPLSQIGRAKRHWPIASPVGRPPPYRTGTARTAASSGPRATGAISVRLTDGQDAPRRAALMRPNPRPARRLRVSRGCGVPSRHRGIGPPAPSGRAKGESPAARQPPPAVHPRPRGKNGDRRFVRAVPHQPAFQRQPGPAPGARRAATGRNRGGRRRGAQIAGIAAGQPNRSAKMRPRPLRGGFGHQGEQVRPADRVQRRHAPIVPPGRGREQG